VITTGPGVIGAYAFQVALPLTSATVPVFPPENGFVVVMTLTETVGSPVNATNEPASAAAAPTVIVINSPGMYSALSNVSVGRVTEAAGATVTVYVVDVAVPAESAIVITEVPAATPVIVTSVLLVATTVATVVVAEVAVIAGVLVDAFPAESLDPTVNVAVPVGAIQVF